MDLYDIFNADNVHEACWKVIVVSATTAFVAFCFRVVTVCVGGL